MKAADYLSSSEFQSLCKVWEENFRCPECFVDWLLDRGLDSQAECARWAVEQDIRSQFYTAFPEAGPYPLKDMVSWMWYFNDGKNGLNHSDVVLRNNVQLAPEDQFRTHKSFETFAEAIAGLMDMWKI